MLMLLLSDWLGLLLEDGWAVEGTPASDESGDFSAMDGPSGYPPPKP